MRFAPGTRLGAYEIEAPLGEGGMGEVYRARDKRLGRDVAIKILCDRLTENRRASSRFEREARAAAALTHPNILSIYEFEVDGDPPFVVTELLEGRTLRERMGARIPWQKAAEIGAAIAEGLAAAHARGITHRDLKPENVFLTNDGRVKILDFGIAHMKQGGEAGLPSDTEPTAEFAANAPLGTVGYVSPEQIRCEEPAPTSDIFSLGVILHEMLAGRNPFAKPTATETLAAILNEEPSPLRPRAGIPPAVAHLVHRCLEKNPEERFQSARDLADRLREVAREKTADAAPRSRVVRSALIAGGGVAAIAVAGFLYFEERPSFAIGGGATQGVTTLAILPLVNATGDPSLDYIADGITESLINQLSALPNLRVTARPTAFEFKGEAADPRGVGKQLSVGTLATGKLDLEGETLHIQADLIDTGSGAQIWGGRFDAPRRQTSALAGRIAAEIARDLEVKLTRAQRARMTVDETTDQVAFDVYLRGRDALNTETPAGRERAIHLLKQAVEADPRFARAHAALGEAYVRYSTTAEPRLMFSNARVAIAAALALDPDLAEAHLSKAMILHWADWDFPGAEREFQRALALNPSLAAANAYYSNLLHGIGDFEEAIRQAQRARELDPLSLVSSISLAGAYMYAGKYAEARAEVSRLLRSDPEYPNAHVVLARVFEVTGDGASACREFLRWDELRQVRPDELEARRDACERGGLAAYKRELLREYSSDPAMDPYYLGALHAELGETAEALRFLDLALRQRSSNMIYLRSDPSFARLRRDPAFLELIDEVGIPLRSAPAVRATEKDRRPVRRG